MRKPKVLITWFSKAIGGAEESIALLCNEIVKLNGLDVVLMYTSTDFENIDYIRELKGSI